MTQPQAQKTQQTRQKKRGMKRQVTQQTRQKKRGMKRQVAINPKILWRVIKDVWRFYPIKLPLALLTLIIYAAMLAAPPLFMQAALDVIDKTWQSGDWAAAVGPITHITLAMAGAYIIGIICDFASYQLMAIVAQGSLKEFRNLMFDNMEYLPIRYFDTNKHGDIMSYYTNDIDALRQMISQSLPQALVTCITLVCLTFIMLWSSIWMMLVTLVGVLIMFVLSRRLVTRAAVYFRAQQKSIADTEGYVQEMMNGQRVVQVFNHEKEACADMEKYNNDLFQNSKKANIYSNILMPILMNMGNLTYVVVAIAAGIFLTLGIPNLSFSGAALTIAIAVPFLNMTRQFNNQIGQVSQQFNPIIMGLAGAERLYTLVDARQEKDDGYVELVKAKMMGGALTETNEHTGIWAWKHPHHETGEVTYTLLAGDVRFVDVDFGYSPDNIVLHDITLQARPGQKVAFVGATGAGKTTITNLINRFYDLHDGKIRYDGINIEKIKKDSLRKSIGLVLQDTNLFTGTVLENIRYGRLRATDEECFEAAKLAGAHDFIERLPEGYNTVLSNNGSQLSQGQRQLISIARAAVADPPVMILDEATSSIDTRTEAIVQRGMDALMSGRTTFVIAHRLSTVRNSDLIIVLDHGRIIEKGTHDQLIKKKGYYYQLYTGTFELE